MYLKQCLRKNCWRITYKIRSSRMSLNHHNGLIMQALTRTPYVHSPRRTLHTHIRILFVSITNGMIITKDIRCTCAWWHKLRWMQLAGVILRENFAIWESLTIVTYLLVFRCVIRMKCTAFHTDTIRRLAVSVMKVKSSFNCSLSPTFHFFHCCKMFYWLTQIHHSDSLSFLGLVLKCCRPSASYFW